MYIKNDISLRNLEKNNLFLKLITIFCIFILCFSLIISWNSPATGYESSIYKSTPLILWFSLSISFIIGTILVILSIAKKESPNDIFRKVGFFLIIEVYAIFIALFIIRGYYAWNWTGDDASHFGWIKDTITSGSVPILSQGYVFTNIYLSEWFLLSDQDLIILIKIVPLIFGLLFIFFMYIFGKKVFSNQEAAILVGILSSCFTIASFVCIVPYILANFFVPFGLYLIIQSSHFHQNRWYIVLGLTLVFFSGFHIIPTFFLIITLIFVFFFKSMRIEHLDNIKSTKNLCNWRKNSVIVFFAVLIISIILIYSKVSNLITKNYLNFGLSTFIGLFDQIVYAQKYGYNVIEYIIKVYGSSIILFSLSAFSIFLIIFKEKQRVKKNLLLSFFGISIALTISIIGLFTLKLPFGPFRLIPYLNICGVLFTGYLLHSLMTERNNENYSLFRLSFLKFAFVIIIITSLFFVGLLNFYPSPYKLSPNYQTTKSEINGLIFLFDHRDVNLDLKGLSHPTRFSHALLSSKEQEVQKLPYFENTNVYLPFHFGYNNQSSLSLIYKQQIDLFLTERDKQIYKEVFPDMAPYRFTQDDFNRLQNDPYLDYIYSNSGFDYLKIQINNQVMV